MSYQRTRQEDLVLNVLQSADVLTMEQMIERLPELSWCELFHAVDSLSRQGTITLRRRGFNYEVAPKKADHKYACVGLEF